MNYEDEDYVRFYTRDTVSWKALGWEGQTVLSLMLHGKFDRAGVFDCDGHDPSHAVTIVTGLPPEIVGVGLKRLLDSKVWVERDGKIVWPKFVHAQSCRRSDKARQRESREKRRSEALGQPVTDSDEPSRPVTRSHTQSQPVTPSLAEPSLAEAEIPPPPSEPRFADSDDEKPLPFDFQLHPVAVAELSKAYGQPEPVIIEAVREFVSYWTLGDGMGKRRAHWQRRCREDIRKKHHAGKLDEIARKLGAESGGSESKYGTAEDGWAV